MRICYLSQSYVPSRRASSVQVMQMCAAWAELSHRVVLVTKDCAARQEPGVADDHTFYGVAPSFRIAKLSRPAWRGGGLLYNRALARLVAQEEHHRDLFYCREPNGARIAARRGAAFAFEAHGPPTTRRLARQYRDFLAAPSCLGLVVISNRLGAHFRERGWVAPELPIVVAPDAAQAPKRDAVVPAPLADAPRPRIGYIGQLYPGKGLRRVLDLASRLPEAGFHVVGGTEERLAALRAAGLPPNVRLHGFVAPGALAGYYAGLDIVLMPYRGRVSGATGRSDLGAWMSPLKMFEYMAAGKAILSSDLPVLREVLRHGENALLVPPDDTEAWIESLGRLIGDEELRRRLGETARREAASRHTWAARARRILDELKVDAS